MQQSREAKGSGEGGRRKRGRREEQEIEVNRTIQGKKKEGEKKYKRKKGEILRKLSKPYKQQPIPGQIHFSKYINSKVTCTKPFKLCKGHGFLFQSN